MSRPREPRHPGPLTVPSAFICDGPGGGRRKDHRGAHPHPRSLALRGLPGVRSKQAVSARSATPRAAPTAGPGWLQLNRNASPGNKSETEAPSFDPTHRTACWLCTVGLPPTPAVRSPPSRRAQLREPLPPRAHAVWPHGPSERARVPLCGWRPCADPAGKTTRRRAWMGN